MKKPIIIIGASGHAKVIIDIVEKEGKYDILGLLANSHSAGDKVLGYDILGRDDELSAFAAGCEGVIVAIGDNYVRSKVFERIEASCPGIPFISAIHPSALIGRDVSIAHGAVIMAGVSINPCCEIGRMCMLNTASSLDHDSTMGDFSSLAPGVVTGGNCHIGHFSAISIGAIIKHGVNIGEHSVIGAGSLVLKDVEKNVVAYGSPAKVIRSRACGETYL